VCDVAPDHGELMQRPDDKEDVIAKRLEVYEAQTRPLIDHYAGLGLLRKVAGEGELDKVFARMEAAALGTPEPVKKVKSTPVKKTVPATVKAAAKKPPAKRAPKKKTDRAAKTARKSKTPNRKPAAKQRAVRKAAKKKK
jgi:adenylate kinase